MADRVKITKGLFMAEIIEDVEYLTKEVGPHPAGTEEEQRAALYIADRMQKDAGFTTVVEDFQCSANDQLPTLICFGAALLAVLLSLVVPGLGFLWMILGIAAAVLFGMEIMGKPVLSRFFKTGASQNVVAKYQPASVGSSPRRRKVILVANYDSAKALQEEKPPFAQFLPIMQKASAIALAVSAFLLLLRSTVLSGDTGALSSIISFLLVICAILFVLPIVRAVLHTMAPYNQSANNNATGVSVMLEVARQVGNGLVSQDELMEQASNESSTVHGEEAAREAGLVPEGASVSYEVDNMSPQESLAAAKAAIAALTGKPVADKVPVADISSRLVKGGGLVPEDEVAASSVRFEETPQPKRKPKQSYLSREMVSATLEEEPVAEPEQAPAPAVADAAADEAPVAADESAAIVEDNAAQSFERPVPAALSGNAFSFSKPSGGTPSWAKAAREKARANKPEAAEPKVARSRYADTVAAQIAEQQASNDRSANRYAADSAQEPAVDSDLSSKLNALRDEIESVDAPRFTSSVESELVDVVAEAAPEAPAPSTEQVGPAPEAASPAEAAPVSRETVEESPAPAQDAVNGKPAPAMTSPVAALRKESEIVANSRALDQDAIEEVVEHSAERHEEPRKPTVRQSASKPHKIHRIAEDLHAAREAERNAFDVHEQNEAAETSSASATSPMDAIKDDGDTLEATGEMPVSPAYADEPYGQSDYDEAAEYIDAMPYDEEPVDEEPAQQPMSFLDRTKQAGERMQNTFASKLKSVRKPSFLRKEEPVVDEAEGFDQRYQEQYVEEPANSYVETEEQFEEDLTASGKTAAVAPVDVSQYIDNEELEDDRFVPIRRINDTPEPVVPPMGYAEEPSAQYGYESDAEESVYNGYAAEDYSAEDSYYAEAEQQAYQDAQPAASPIVGMEEMLPVPTANEAASAPKRQVIVLPEVTSSHPVDEEGSRQRAPMADSANSTQAGARSLLSNMLPSIETDDASDPAPKKVELNLPSLGNTGSQQAVSTTGSFSTVGGTGSFAPVGDELVSDIDPEERYVEDADDSAYDEDYTENGAFAGTGYVEMPKSRAGRLFGHFRKKNKPNYETSVNEWVDVDESYNARSVGKARGDWSSFQEGNNQLNSNSRDWNGGAFSLDRLRKGQQPAAEAADMQDDGYMETNPAVRIDGDSQTAEQINHELKKLQEFRHPDIDTEVWFVALGAEHYSHSGMNAFLDEHADELRGAVIVNLEALGAGTLSFVEEEGAYRPFKVSSRLKRVFRQAADKSGVRYSVDKIVSRETPASVAMARGVQAVTFAGMGEGNTALYSADNDIFENVNEKTLNDAAKFTLSFLKCF